MATPQSFQAPQYLISFRNLQVLTICLLPGYFCSFFVHGGCVILAFVATFLSILISLVIVAMLELSCHAWPMVCVYVDVRTPARNLAHDLRENDLRHLRIFCPRKCGELCSSMVRAYTVHHVCYIRYIMSARS